MSEALARDWITFEPELNQLKASFSTWKLLQEKIQIDDDSQGSANCPSVLSGPLRDTRTVHGPLMIVMFITKQKNRTLHGGKRNYITYGQGYRNSAKIEKLL